MNLQKDKWEKVKFGEIAKSSNLACDPLVDGIERFVAGEHMITDEIKIKNCGNVNDEILGPAFHRKFLPNQILYGSRRTYLRKVAISDFEGVCANTTFVIDANTNKTSIYFLACVMQSEKFTEFSINNSKGSTNPFINWKDLAAFIVYLPPLDEQQRIVALFQSIEQAIIQAEGQEKNLKLLQKTLSNGLVSVPPVFGNLLAKSQTSEVSKTSEVLVLFGDVVECIEEHDKKPLEHGLTRFIGLENIEPENFSLQGFGNIEDGTTFTKRFAKGDVLFGKRRAYLKKVAVADYDGICSSDILVFRAIEKEILPELLPYYVSSDTFMNLAVSTSAGSLSPRTKWRDLAGFQLFLPDVKIQEKMVDVFNQLRQSLRLLSQQKETLKTLKQKLLNEILG